jgi:hypothetical protein
MVWFPLWIESNWFNVIQTVGIVGSLWMGAAAAHREAKAREIENLLTITTQHRDLWAQAQTRKDLRRVLQSDVDVQKSPLTQQEFIFLNSVIVHLELGWLMSRSGAAIKMRELENDLRGFISLPLPRTVWEKTNEFRNQQFVKFVEGALTGGADSSRSR